MYIDEEFKELVNEKYQEMKRLSKNEDFLDEKRLGGIKIFINSKPEFCLLTLHFENADLVFVGSNEM